MADPFFERMADDLRRQREDLERDMNDQTQSEKTTADLLERIEALRARSEKTIRDSERTGEKK